MVPVLDIIHIYEHDITLVAKASLVVLYSGGRKVYICAHQGYITNMKYSKNYVYTTDVNGEVSCWFLNVDEFTLEEVDRKQIDGTMHGLLCSPNNIFTILLFE